MRTRIAASLPIGLLSLAAWIFVQRFALAQLLSLTGDPQLALQLAIWMATLLPLTVTGSLLAVLLRKRAWLAALVLGWLPLMWHAAQMSGLVDDAMLFKGCFLYWTALMCGTWTAMLVVDGR